MRRKPSPPEEKPRKRARDRGEVVPFGVEISAAHAQALDALRARLRWSKRAAAEAAIEALLAQHGLWPSPSAEE